MPIAGGDELGPITTSAHGVFVKWAETYDEPEESLNVVAEATAFHCYQASFLRSPYLTGTGIGRCLWESALIGSNEKEERSC